MYNSTMRTAVGRTAWAVVGVFIMVIGLNFFITPVNLYCTGLMGYAQLIRSLLAEDLGIVFSNIDLSGVLYYALCVPILFITYRSMGKSFLIRTIVFSLLFSAAVTLIPIPKEPLVDDVLTNAIIGGILVGFGDGITLTCGYNVGGLDLLAIHISKKGGVKVGQFSTYANALLFVGCFFKYDSSIVLYSIILMAATFMTLDRMYQQTINVEALIFTKNLDNDMLDEFMRETGRGVTYWDGYGGYTNARSRVLCICINRYEKEQLERIIKKFDPQAFIITIPGVQISGHFIHKV